MIEKWLLQASIFNLLFLILVSVILVYTLYKGHHRAVRATLLFVFFTLIAILLKTVLLVHPCWNVAVQKSLSINLVGVYLLDIFAFCIGIVEILSMRGRPANWLKYLGCFCLAVIAISFFILIRNC